MTVHSFIPRLLQWLERRPRVTPLLLLPLTFALFNAGWNYHRAWATIPNELLPISLLRDGDAEFSEYWDEHEFQPYFHQTLEGRIVSMQPIVPGLLNVPVYVLAKVLRFNPELQRFRLSLITASLVCSLAVCVFYLILRELGLTLPAALGFALLLALGSGTLSMASKGVWPYGPTMLFLNLALYGFFSRDQRGLAWSGFWLGWAVFNQPVNLVFAVVFSVYMLLAQPRRCPVYFALAAIPATALAAYSAQYWGTALAMGRGQVAGGSEGRLLTGLAGLLISPGRGLLVYSPFLVFALPELWRALRAPGAAPPARCLALALVLSLLIYGKWASWWGGWCFGSLLLSGLTPGLMLFLALAWKNGLHARPAARRIFFALAALAVYFHLLGALIYPSDFNYSPNNIDEHQERLWNPLDNELTRCSKILLRRIYEDQLF